MTSREMETSADLEHGGKSGGNRGSGPAIAIEARVLCLQARAVGVAVVVAPKLLAAAVDLPKRLLVEWLVIAGFVALLAECLETARRPVKAGPLALPLLAVLAGTLVSSAFAVNTAFALEHVGLLAAYAGIAWLVVSGVTRGQFDRIVAALLLAGGIEGIYGILQYAGIDFLPWHSTWGSRCFGTIGNPVFYAEFLAPIFILGVALWLAEKDEERKDLLALLSVVLFLALIFAQTRSAWVGSAVGLAVLGACLWKGTQGGAELLRRNRGWLLAFAGFALAVVLTISSPAVFGKHALPIGNRLADAIDFKSWTVRHRMVLWHGALLMVRDSPVFGCGAEHFRSQFPLKQAAFREELTRGAFHYAPKEQKCHSDYLQTAAEFGLVGLGLWLWLLATLARAGLVALRRSAAPENGALVAGLLGGLTSLAVDSFFNFPFRTIPAATVFWLMAGGLVLLSRPGISAPPAWVAVSKIGSRWRRAVAAVAAVVAVIWCGWLAVPQILADRAKGEGDRYFGSNMFEMARAAYERSLMHRPYDVIVIYRLGLTHDKTAIFDWSGRNWDRALRSFERAERLGLNDELLFGQMALVMEKKGKYDRAIEMVERSIEIYPEKTDHIANLAYWHSVRERRIDLALELSEQALAAFPTHPLYLWIRGLVLEKAKRYGEALEALETALPNLPKIENGHVHAPELKRDVARVREKSGV